MEGASIARMGALWAFVVAAGCGGSGPTVSTWASEADEVVAALTEAYDVEDAYQTARFFSAGGTLDLTIWGQGVATTPDEVVEAVERVWWSEPGFADVGAEHLFVTPGGAIVWWRATAFAGFQNWAQTFAFGSGNRAASRAYTAIETGFDQLDSERQAAVDFVDRYLAAWAGEQPLTSVYTDRVVVRDEIAGWEWNGIDEVSAGLATAPPVQRGPWPTLFGYRSGETRELVVLVQLAGDCPMLEARRLSVIDERVGWETRYTHVPSARRCLDAIDGLDDAWWTTFELPDELQNNVTEIVDSGGTTVELVNAEPIHGDYVRWMVDRFIEGGLGPPKLSAVWFPPNPDCVGTATGLAMSADERYEGEQTIALCFDEDLLVWGPGESGWAIPAVALGLHELAHLWMREYLDDATRAAFTERVGLSSWRDGVPWEERGVERAAYTIAWGLAGTEDARYRFVPAPECEELAARYELLTGRSTLTTCGENGWSQ